MLATVALSAAAVVVVGLLVWAFLRHDRVDETERFHRAREITTSWAAPGPQVHDTVPAPTAVDAEAATPAPVDDLVDDVVDDSVVEVVTVRPKAGRGAAKPGAAAEAVAGDGADPG